MSKACLVDLTKCIACRACQVACKEWNGLEAEHTEFFGAPGGYQNPPALSSKTFTLIRFVEMTDSNGKLKWVFARSGCMHCQDPACASACPVGALKKTDEGAVVYDDTKCFGCRYCMMACPFDVPTFQWESPIPLIRKCTFCADRQGGDAGTTSVNDRPLSEESVARHRDSNRTPACVKACPTGTLKFGERGELLAEARNRMTAEPGKYIDHIYGEQEVGGTSWMYISDVPFDQLGFRTDLGKRSYPSYTSPAMKAIPAVVTGLGLLLSGVYWVANRKAKAAKSVQEDSDQA